MKVLVVLDRKWSSVLFPKVINALKTTGVSIPVYLIHHGPYDFELALCKEFGIKGYRRFPLNYEDIDREERIPGDVY